MNRILTTLTCLVLFSCNTIKISSSKNKSQVYKELIKEFEQENPFEDTYEITRTIQVREVIDTINNLSRIRFLEWIDPVVVLPEKDFKTNFTIYNNRIYYWDDIENSKSAASYYNLLETYGIELDSCARYSHLKKLDCDDIVVINNPIVHRKFKVLNGRKFNKYKRI